MVMAVRFATLRETRVHEFERQIQLEESKIRAIEDKFQSKKKRNDDPRSVNIILDLYERSLAIDSRSKKLSPNNHKKQSTDGDIARRSREASR